jgi:threonine dehydrogenase-like Zn-dependent dehydrogenase
VIFECVGVAGIMQQILEGAPLFSRIVGWAFVCKAIRSNLHWRLIRNWKSNMYWVIHPLEFRDTLHMIAEGKVDCSPLITGVVGLEGVGNAFEAARSRATCQDSD